MPTRWFCLGLLLGMSVISTGLGQGGSPRSKPFVESFAIETFVVRAYNYLDNMVDKDGLLTQALARPLPTTGYQRPTEAVAAITPRLLQDRGAGFARAFGDRREDVGELDRRRHGRAAAGTLRPPTV